jgi:general secretion pathway protein J
MSDSKTPQHGFTLIEILLAIGIFSLLMTMLFGAMHLAARNAERGSAQIDRSAQVALVQGFLRGELADARALKLPRQGRPVVDFDGNARRLAFISPAMESVGFGGLQRLEIALETDPGLTVGILSAVWQPYRPTPEAASPAARRTRLLANIRTAAFAYYGANGQGALQEWQDTWHDKPQLPLLVRLSVIFTDGTLMPELTIAVRAAAGAPDPTQRF